MEIETSFRVGDPLKKLENAKIIAKELGTVNCSWHSHCATVGVILDEHNELKWKIQDCCCDSLNEELAKAI